MELSRHDLDAYHHDNGIHWSENETDKCITDGIADEVGDGPYGYL